MDIKDTRLILRRIADDADLLKSIVKEATDNPRLLLDHEIHQEFAGYLEKIGADIASSEVRWRAFGLPFANSKKVAIQSAAK